MLPRKAKTEATQAGPDNLYRIHAPPPSRLREHSDELYDSKGLKETHRCQIYYSSDTEESKSSQV
jgi:hypothetical protein